MKKRILSCLMALALCLTLLPTAALAEEPEGTAQTSPAVEEAADPANGKAKQENQPAEQEEQQEDSATKQDEAVAAVQAMIDALPDAAELDGMDDADAMAVYEAFQTACDAYYDTLTEGQQAQLKNTEKLAALSDWFSQLETLAEGDTHTDHPICGLNCSHAGEKHTVNAFTDATKLWMKDGTLMKGTDKWDISEVSVYDKTETAYVLDSGVYYLGSDLKFTGCTTEYAIMINGDVKLCLNGCSITCENPSTNYVIAVYADADSELTLTDCKTTGTIKGGKSAGVELRRGYTLNMYGGTITGSSKGVNIDSSTFNMYGGTISGNSGRGVFMSAGTFNMSGGTISGNNGGVSVGTESEFNMSGGEITRNAASGDGGGVVVYINSKTITVSGTARITGNTVNGKPNNVYLQQGKSFIATNLTKGAEIGVTTEKAPTSSAPIKVANVGTDYSAYIKSDQAGYTVEYINDSTFTGMVLAIQEHQHCLCGETTCNGWNGHSKQEINFIPWTDALANQQERGKTASNSLPSKTGNYYLTGDVTLSNTWKPVDGTVLCLNGHSITMNGNGDITAILVYSGIITLCDCKGDGDAYGQITHTVGKNGSGVSVGGTGGFYMYGGSITNNTADNGGGVYMAGGQFTMYGGEISRNTTTTGDGGGVYVGDGTFTMSGTASITGNKTANDTYGGGVYVSGNGTFNMNDKASITDNTANQGGGVYVSGGEFTMSGGSITGNKGNGVCVAKDGTTFTVSGAATVKGNKRNNGVSNVFLGGSKTTITIGGALTDGASIGVTKAYPRVGGIIATGANEDYSGKFFSDDSTYVVKYDNKQLVLAVPSAVTHTHSYNENTWSKDTTNHWHECTDADCPNKSESIKDKAAHVYDNNADTTCNVCGYVRTVTPGNIPVSGVALNETSTSISVGNSEKLIATVTPNNATDQRVTWTSSNENVATVAADGTVTAKAPGIAEITATAADGSGKYATCTVTVTGGTTPSQPGGGGSSGGGGGSSSGGSSGGGGGSSSPSNHPVKAEVSKDPDGSVSLSKTSAAKGDKVTITVKPERYYEVDEVIVRDSKGKQLAVKDNGDGTFTFEMPADKVTVEPSFSWVNPFADVADSAYYVDAVEWMLKREVTQGTTETTFSPDLNCTRAQIVTFLWRVAGSPAPKGTVSFADVSADSYYAKAVAWATENGITDGIGGGLFSPDATCTRAQSAVFLYRVAGSPAVNGSAGFSDVAADAYYAQAVAWAKEHGITDGIGGGLFGSANDCTRAQIAAFLYRYMK